MIQLISATLVAAILMPPEVDFVGRTYQGTWAGRTLNGSPVVLTIRPDSSDRENATFSYQGQDLGPQIISAEGNRIRLSNSTSDNYMIVGPVEGDQLFYFWTNGTKRTNTTILIRQKKMAGETKGT